MPIYEFYCSDCNTLLNFFSSGIDTATQPACPHCGRPELERRPARFATLRRTGGEDAEDPLSSIDDERMDGVMASLLDQMDGLEGADEDPRRLAQVMRRFGAGAGLELGPKMEEMVRRLEMGEDPDAIESEIDFDDDEEGFDDLFRLKKRLAASARRPKVDDELYFL